MIDIDMAGHEGRTCHTGNALCAILAIDTGVLAALLLLGWRESAWVISA